jgi:branched-chain amino acid transport system substrate-binding protein
MELGKRWTTLTGAILTSILAVAACGGPSTSGSGGGTFVIGGINGLTQPISASIPQAIVRGINLYVDKVNASGGVNGNKIEFRNQDNAGDTGQAVALFKSFATDSSVLAVLGPNRTPDAIATTPLSNQFKLVSIATGASAPWTVPFGTYQFRVPISSGSVTDGLVKATQKALNVKTAAIVHSTDEDYSVAGGRLFAAATKKYGIAVATTQTYRHADTDYSAQLNSIKSSGVKYVYMSSTADNAGPMMKQGKQLGLNVTWIGDINVVAPNLWQLSGGAAQGLITVIAFDSTSSASNVKQLIADYQKKYGTAPDQWAGYGYDAMGLIASALAKAGAKPTRDSLRDALAKAKFSGVTGDIAFPDGSGDAFREAPPLVTVDSSGSYVQFKS